MPLSLAKHVIAIALIVLFPGLVTGQPRENTTIRFSGSGTDNSVVSLPDRIILEYSLPEIELSESVQDGKKYTHISIPGHVRSSEAGKPSLPVLSTLITIPEGSAYKIRFSQVKSERIRTASKGFRGLVYPSQHSQVKTARQENSKLIIDDRVYSSKSFIGYDTARIEHLGRTRGIELASLQVSPVSYNPRSGVIEVITSMKIEVIFTKSSDQVPLTTRSLIFNQQMDKGLLNYSPDDVVPGFSDKPVRMVILTDTSFRKHLEPLVRWKTQKGFRVNVLYRGTGLAGNTYTQLRDTLMKIYRSATPTDPAPEYLLIVGDVGKIPYYGTGNITDLYYGEYDGDGDYIPEVYIGRIPVSDTTELKSVVKKIIQYEKFDFAETNKFHASALSFAGDEPAYANTMNGQVKYAVTNYLTKQNNINERHFYYPHNSLSTTKDSVIKLINSGISFINYTGHGDANGLLHVNIKTPDIASLSNAGMYPFFISNACRTAQYNLAPSFGNRMVLSVDKGAIGFIGCSNDSYWDEDFYWAVGVGTITQDPSYYATGPGALDRLFHTHSEKASEWYYTMGQVNFAGNLSVGASTSKWKKYYWETYNLIGDPSMIPIIGTPKKFTVSVPDTLPNGIRSLTMSVDPFAYVAVSRNDTLWDASFAGPSGSVQLDLPGASNSQCLFVITGQNRYPVIKTVYFRNLSREYINLSGNSINDIKGNNNGRADFGETFYLSIKVSNLGQSDATGAYARIRTDSDWAQILNDSVFIGSIPAGSETVIHDRLELKVDSDVPDLGYIPVKLTLKSSKSEKNYSIDIPVHAPELKIMNCVIDDRASGNGDLVADPGETFFLVFKIANSGTSTTSGQFNLTSLLPNLTILEPDVKSGDLNFGETSDIRIQVSLSESTLSGEFFSVSALLSCAPYQLTKEFDFRAGKIRESFESQSFAVFPWINTGQVPWTITEKAAFEGSLSARSGAISNSSVTTLKIKTIYEKPDSLRFFYRVSSEPNYDYLSFKLNDKEMLRKSGEVPWSRKAVYVQPGINVMEWTYKKDNSVFLGSDCAWIDLIDFAGTSPVRYIGKDLQVTAIESPEVKDKYGKETITVRVKNHGIASQKGFNLAYSINGSSPVKQLFNEVIEVNDSVTVSFPVKADFSKYGKYDLRIYGTDNGDDYLQNDTLKAEINNIRLDEVFSVFPNPFNTEFTLFLNSQWQEEAEVFLTDTKGSKVYSIYKQIAAGVNTFVFNDFRLAPGTYYLTVKGKNISKTLPVIKTK